ncbi:MAG: hypothetical protein JXO72_09140 [Vicinamibacteria bacterium]|nr:hypothetical protein [Vicinamibacteria bacterium]
MKENAGMAEEEKKPYETPEVVRIRLAKDEMAATGCKLTRPGIEGPKPGFCTRPPTPCRLAGS